MRPLVTPAFALAFALAVAAPVRGHQPAQSAPTADVAVDVYRLAERGYAEALIARADALLGRAAGNREQEAAAHAQRAVGLAALDRDEEAAAALRLALERQPSEPRTYWLCYLAARHLPAPEPLLDVVTAASRFVPPESRSDLHLIFTLDDMLWLHRMLSTGADPGRLALLSEALVAIGWPGDHDPQAGDIFRMDMVDRHLAAGDRAAAARVAATVAGPEAVQMLAIDRRYEGLSPAWERPAETIAAAWDRQDRTTRAALLAQPNSLRYLLLRVRLLRARGREAEAAELLAPSVATAETTYAPQPQGRLVLEEAAQALFALGRVEEAVAVSTRLAALEQAMDARDTAAAVRHVGFLWQAGRTEASIAEGERLLRERGGHLTAYARSWLLSVLSCALRDAGRTAEAEIHLRSLLESGHPPAGTRALLCANRLDEAEALVIRRLEEGDRLVLQALQDWRSGGAAAGRLAPLEERLRILRARGRVAAALERVGRVLPLPATRMTPEIF
jgi:tetratricopeptide (TPR) repeat protein